MKVQYIIALTLVVNMQCVEKSQLSSEPLVDRRAERLLEKRTMQQIIGNRLVHYYDALNNKEGQLSKSQQRIKLRKYRKHLEKYIRRGNCLIAKKEDISKKKRDFVMYLASNPHTIKRKKI